MCERTALLQPAVEVTQNVIVKVPEMPGELVASQQLCAHEGVHGLGLLLIVRQEVDVEVEGEDLAQDRSCLRRDGR